ncbi:uncharacterized protein J3R85_011898 [Psidium guajava]|nr:uncharacterized protein J3R85_011898 [Psidium guajava]
MDISRRFDSFVCGKGHIRFTNLALRSDISIEDVEVDIANGADLVVGII